MNPYAVSYVVPRLPMGMILVFVVDLRGEPTGDCFLEGLSGGRSALLQTLRVQLTIMIWGRATGVGTPGEQEALYFHV